MKQTLFKILGNPVKALFVGVVRFYQVVISPGIPGRCKYYPSCSQYALEALREYGAVRGFVLGAWRILRCNPLSYGGYDPVSRQKLFRSRGSAFGELEAARGDTVAGEPVVTNAAACERRGSCSHSGPPCHSVHGRLVRG